MFSQLCGAIKISLIKRRTIFWEISRERGERIFAALAIQEPIADWARRCHCCTFQSAFVASLIHLCCYTYVHFDVGWAKNWRGPRPRWRTFPNGRTWNAPLEQRRLIPIFNCHRFPSIFIISCLRLIKAFFHSSSIIISIVGKCDDEWRSAAHVQLFSFWI